MNLELASSDELINELLKRHDNMVMVGMKVITDKGKYISFRRWIGNSQINIGMIEIAKLLIAQEEIQNTMPMKKDI